MSYSFFNMCVAQYQLKYKRAEAIIGYRPRKPYEGYPWEALQVAGSGQCRIGGRLIYDGNKRLAIQGDTAMTPAIDGTLGDSDSKRQRLLSNWDLGKIILRAHAADFVCTFDGHNTQHYILTPQGALPLS